jgi:hypothetical protein
MLKVNFDPGCQKNRFHGIQYRWFQNASFTLSMAIK